MEWVESEEEELPDVDGLAPLRSLDELRQGTVATVERENLDPDEALRRFWGYPNYRPLQNEAVQAALGKRDCLVVLPTGGGKSLCYQVPAACGAGLVVVVSPLIALMDDQVAAARQAGLRAGALHSMLPEAERAQIYRQLDSDGIDLLYVSPERFAVGDLLGKHGGRLALVAVDEAHCISHWGHDFRPEYRQLGELLGGLADVPRMALTATATPQVQDDIVAQLGLRDAERLIGHPDRPNLCYRSLPRRNALSQIMTVVERHRGDGGIIYAQTRREVERLSDGLIGKGVSAGAYHAGLPPEERRRVQEAFLSEQLDVVVATIAFGMGIDRSDVRFVIHANAPRSIEHYQQESGRAGRDGLPADCVLLYSAGDLSVHRQLAERDKPSEARRRALQKQLSEIGRYAMAPLCRHRLLTEHFGQRLDEQDSGCGACDVCLGETRELEPDDALRTAQKIISAVWRCESRFGAAHICNVLLGRKDEKIRRQGHDQLSVHGLLAGVGEHAVRAWIDQLIVQDLLQQVDRDRFTLLALTDAGVALCKGSGSVRLSRIEAPKSSSSSSGKRGKEDVSWEGVDRDCFERLRRLRRMLAEAQGLPPYVVFNDATLRELAIFKPSDRDGMLLIKGIGEHKMERYGAAFLALLRGNEPDAAMALVDI